MNVTDAAVICKALGDSNRLQIVQMLSHHMKTLCECGLVNDRKEGKWHHYSINSEVWKEFSNFVSLTGKVE